MPQLSRAQARRIALAAQGIGIDRSKPITMRQVQTEIDRLAQFQIDTVNVLERAHYFPIFTRRGPYERSLLRRASDQAPRRLMEYEGHAASLIDINLYPALRFRMREAPGRMWRYVAEITDRRPGFVAEILEQVSQRGPLSARELASGGVRSKERWGWNWSDEKIALEWLLQCGKVLVAGRNASFERYYDLPERVLPAALLGADLDRAAAHVELVRRAATALGVATLGDLSDYFRTDRSATAAAIQVLTQTGELESVHIAGCAQPHWLWARAARPRRIGGAWLVSPFDSLVFERNRLARLFGVDYRIEIYVPKPKRKYGYYVYLLVCNDEVCARVDLKGDRQRGVLMVQSAWLEPGAPEAATADALGRELVRLARWQGLGEIEVASTGNLHLSLAAAPSLTV